MLEPEQREADYRKQDVCVEDHSGIPRRKIVCLKHICGVSACCPEEKAGGPRNRGSAHVEAPAESEKAYGRESQAREPEFGLERAVRPTDEARGHPAEEDVKNEVVKTTEPDRKEKEV